MATAVGLSVVAVKVILFFGEEREKGREREREGGREKESQRERVLFFEKPNDLRERKKRSA